MSITLDSEICMEKFHSVQASNSVLAWQNYPILFRLRAQLDIIPFQRLFQCLKKYLQGGEKSI